MIKNRFNGNAVFIFALFLFSCHSAYAQHNALLEIQRSYDLGLLSVNEAAQQQLGLLNDSSSESEIIKCATPIFAFIHQHREEISPLILQQVYNSDRVASSLNKKANVFITESGKFEIYYETTGPDSVSINDINANGIPDYVEWVGEAADSSYRYQVESIGFKDPIPDGSRYEIHIEDLGNVIYGFTQTVNTGPTQTLIVIENDFEGFPQNTDLDGRQKGSVKVTVAHEFKHAIQFATLNRWLATSWAEMDATLMEEVVYDDVNDYYNYIKHGLDSVNPTFSSIFGSPYRGLPGSGYNTVTWMIYYFEKFGINLWKNVWDLMEAEDILDIAEALSFTLSQPDFNSHFIKSHLWHFASAVRAPTVDYGFEERNNYPIANTERYFRRVPEFPVEINSINRLAARYYEISPGDLDEGIIDIAIDFDTTQIGLGLLMYLKSGEVKEVVASGENKAQLYIPTDVRWENLLQMGVVVANYSQENLAQNLSLQFGKNGNRFKIVDPVYIDLPEMAELSQNYPNPFNPQTTIEFILPKPSSVKLEVFDVLGRKIQTLINRNLTLGPHSRIFDASGLSSGIYLYRLQVDDRILVKKMMLMK